MIQLLDENNKAQIEQKIKTVSDETNSLKGDLDRLSGFNAELDPDEVRYGNHKGGVADYTTKTAICTRDYVKPFVKSITVVDADYHLAVCIFNNGAYERTVAWIDNGSSYTFDHTKQYKLYIGRVDQAKVLDFDAARKSVMLTMSSADVLYTYNRLTAQMDVERENTRNALEYMMRRNYDISFANAPAPLNLITYVGNNQIVHPKVLYFPNKFGGHRYWMAYNPYPWAIADYENPCIAYSDDGYEWTNIDGNPMDDPNGNGYNSDTHLVYVESTETLEVWYRYVGDYATTPVPEIIYRQTSKDGINWTEKEVVINNTSGDYVQYLSPAVIHDGNIYKMWVVNSTENTINYYESEVAAQEETISLDNAMSVGKVMQQGVIDETDTNYMYTEKIQLNSTKSFQLTGVNLNGVTVHPALRCVTAYDADGNVLTDYSQQSIPEASISAGRIITMDDSVDSVVITIYKANNYTSKTVTLPAVEGGKLAKVRDITLTYQDGEDVYKPWHIDAIEDDEKTVLLITCKCGTTWSLFLSISDNNITFTAPKLAIVGNPYGWDKQIYRSSIVNVNGEYRIYYSAQDEKQRHGLGLSTSRKLSEFVGKIYCK